MGPTLHRQTPNRSREQRERAWALVAQKLGDAVICARCRGTYKTYSDTCTADLDDPCPGFNAIDAAYGAARREVGLT